MKNFNIGYYHKPCNKTDFVILAQTKNEYVAMAIRDMYNSEYKRNGMSVRVEIIEDNDLPKEYRFSL